MVRNLERAPRRTVASRRLPSAQPISGWAPQLSGEGPVLRTEGASPDSVDSMDPDRGSPTGDEKRLRPPGFRLSPEDATGRRGGIYIASRLRGPVPGARREPT